MQAAKPLQQFVKLFICSLLLCSFSSASLATENIYDKLQVTDLEGNSVDLNQHKGGIVLVNFWATWCPPCVKEMPSLQRLQQQFKPDEFKVVLVNLGQSVSTVNDFFKQQTLELSLPVYLDAKGGAFTALGIKGMPLSYLINDKGETIEAIVGAREWDHPANIAAVRQLMNQPQSED